VSATPDTGCTRTIIKATRAKEMGLKVKRGEKISLIAANGVRMEVLGTTIVEAESNNCKATLDAIVSNAVQDDMLVSCVDLIALRAIPRGFPNTEIVECRKLGTRSREPMKTEAPMHISMKKGQTRRR